MKGLKTVAKKTQNAIYNNRSTWVSLFYNISEDKVYTAAGDGRFYMTDLINPCTEKDVEKAVYEMLSM